MAFTKFKLMGAGLISAGTLALCTGASASACPMTNNNQQQSTNWQQTYDQRDDSQYSDGHQQTGRTWDDNQDTHNDWSDTAQTSTYDQSSSYDHGTHYHRARLVSADESADNTGASQLDRADVQAVYKLDSDLHEHAALAAPVLKAQLLQEPDAPALIQAVNNNSVAVSNDVDQLYPGTKAQFLPVWQSHIDAYNQYLAAAKQQDAQGQQAAKDKLATAVDQMTNLLVAANPQLDAENLKQQLTEHGNQTTMLIDQLVAGNYPEVYALAHEAYVHMTMVTLAMTGITL
jgi:hypothetical protein